MMDMARINRLLGRMAGYSMEAGEKDRKKELEDALVSADADVRNRFLGLPEGSRVLSPERSLRWKIREVLASMPGKDIDGLANELCIR